MDFSQVKAITIPEGAVKQITDGLGRVLWKVVSGDPYLKQPITFINNDSQARTLTIYALIRNGRYNATTSNPEGNQSAYCYLEYSTDRGSTWYTKTSETTNHQIPAGGSIMFRCKEDGYWNFGTLKYQYSNPTTSSEWETSAYKGQGRLGIQVTTGNWTVEGNIMSLVRASFADVDWSTYKWRGLPTLFNNLFAGCTTLTNASHLRLPLLWTQRYYSYNASNFNSTMYKSMFYGCTGLVYAPEYIAYQGDTADVAIKGSTSSPICIQEALSYMFYGCTALETAPILCLETNTIQKQQTIFYNCRKVGVLYNLCKQTMGDYDRFYERSLNSDRIWGYTSSNLPWVAYYTGEDASNKKIYVLKDELAQGAWVTSVVAASKGFYGLPPDNYGWEIIKVDGLGDLWDGTQLKV